MTPSSVVAMYVGAECRALAWTPELAAHWATVARLALPVVEVTPTPVPLIWVDGTHQPGLEDLMRLALHTATWEASSLWLTLLTADRQLAETVLSLAVSRPMVYPLVMHFQPARQRRLLTHLASGGTFHLALDTTGLVIPALRRNCWSRGATGCRSSVEPGNARNLSALAAWMLRVSLTQAFDGLAIQCCQAQLHL